MLKRLLLGLIALAVLTLASTACNTVRGAGEDVQSVGDTIRSNTP